jgi:N-acetyl-anhydromuramyl-L-alanine amidase AmpD
MLRLASFGLLVGGLGILAPLSLPGAARADEAVPPEAAAKATAEPVTQPASDLRVAPAASAAPASAVVSVVRGPESTAALARRLGVTHQDDGSSVLLTRGGSRVRVYPGTHVISFDGQDRSLRGLMARGPHGVMLPGPAAAMIEQHLAKSAVVRSERDEPAAAKDAPKKTAAAKTPGLKPLKLAPLPEMPKAAPAVAPAAERTGSVKPDAGWDVAATDRAWRWIVLHHSDDVCGSLDKYHRVHLDKGWEHGCGYHFVIGNGSKSGDGQVEVSQRWTRQLHGAHAKTDDNLFNDFGIGICLVGDFERGGSRPSAAQMRALIRLTQWLLDRYDLPVSAVRGHCHCKPTCCPGKNFPWAELKAGLREPARRTTAAAPGAAPAAGPALAQKPAADAIESAAADPLGSPPAGPLPLVR